MYPFRTYSAVLLPCYMLLPIFRPDGAIFALRVIGWHAFQSMKIRLVFILLRHGAQAQRRRVLVVRCLRYSKTRIPMH